MDALARFSTGLRQRGMRRPVPGDYRGIGLRACLLVLMLAVPACATQPESIDQTLAYAEAQVTAVAKTAADSRDAMSDEEYQEVLDGLTEANALLDDAWEATQHDREKLAHENTQAALQVIESLRAKLAEVNDGP